MLRLVLLLTLLIITPVIAGNVISEDQFTIDQEGFSLGYKSPYNITSNQEVLFDKDIETDLSNEVIQDLNNILVDVKLNPRQSDTDYIHASEIFSIDPAFNLMFEPKRFFVFLGSGFSNQFFANLRVYENGDPACFVGLRKDLWDLTTYDIQKEVLTHELFHCLKWAHASNNPFTDNFDFTSNDNVEVLDRLYDSLNTKDRVIVNIIKNPGDVVGFIGPIRSSGEPARAERSTYTSGNQVKLIKGSYKVQVNDKYIRKVTKKGVIKYTSKLKKAKKFRKKFKDQNVLDFYVVN